MDTKTLNGEDFLSIEEVLNLTGMNREDLCGLTLRGELEGWKAAGKLGFYRKDVESLMDFTNSNELDERQAVKFWCFA